MARSNAQKWAYTVRKPGIPTKAPRTQPFARGASEESSTRSTNNLDNHTEALHKSPAPFSPAASDEPSADATAATEPSNPPSSSWRTNIQYSKTGVAYVVLPGRPPVLVGSTTRPPYGSRRDEDESSESSTDTTRSSPPTPSDASSASTGTSGSEHSSESETTGSAPAPAPATASGPSGAVPTPVITRYDGNWDREALVKECQRLLIKGRTKMRNKDQMIVALNAFVALRSASGQAVSYTHREGAPFHEDMERAYLIKACKAHGIPTHDKRNRKQWSKALNDAIPVGSEAAGRVAERVAAWEKAEAAGLNRRKRKQGDANRSDYENGGVDAKRRHTVTDSDSSSSESSTSSSGSSDEEGSRRKKKKKEEEPREVPRKDYHRRLHEHYIDHVLRLQLAIRDANRFLSHNQAGKSSEAGRKLRRQILELKRRLNYLLNLSLADEKDVLKREEELCHNHVKDYSESSSSGNPASEEPSYADDTDEIDIHIIPKKYRSRAAPSNFNCDKWDETYDNHWHIHFFRRAIGRSLRRNGVFSILRDVKQLFQPTGAYDMDEFPAILDPFVKALRIEEMFVDMGMNFNGELEPERVPSMIKWLILHLLVDKMRIAELREQTAREDEDEDEEEEPAEHEVESCEDEGLFPWSVKEPKKPRREPPPPKKPARRRRVDPYFGPREDFEPREKAERLMCAKHRYAVRYWILRYLLHAMLEETGASFVEERVEQWVEERLPLLMVLDGEEETKLTPLPEWLASGTFGNSEKLSEVVWFLRRELRGEEDIGSKDDGTSEEIVSQDEVVQEKNAEDADAPAEFVDEDGDAEMSDAGGADEAEDIVETWEAEPQLVEAAEDIMMRDGKEESDVSEAD